MTLFEILFFSTSDNKTEFFNKNTEQVIDSDKNNKNKLITMKNIIKFYKRYTTKIKNSPKLQMRAERLELSTHRLKAGYSTN